MKKHMFTLISASLLAICSNAALAHGPGGIHAQPSKAVQAEFDLVHTRVFRDRA